MKHKVYGRASSKGPPQLRGDVRQRPD